MTFDSLVKQLPVLTVTLTAVALWLSGEHTVKTRIVGWSLGLVTQMLLTFFGIVTAYHEFALHSVIGVILARNIYHNRRSGASQKGAV